MNVTKNSDEFTILLVDDREENLLSLEEMLAREGRTFIKVTSGNEALRHALRNDQIGLIMLDVQMPEMDGFEVAQLLKSNPKTKDISIIFVTAISRDEQYVLKGFEQGAVDYLQKPLDINVTKAKVNVFEQLYFYQRNLKKTAAELEAINKQLEKFVYIVAHDLKSPLTGLIAALSLMEMINDSRPIEQDEVTEYIDSAKEAAHHLSNMITSLLDYSRKSLTQQTMEEVDVYELVSQIATLLFPPRHIEIRVHKPMPVLKTRKLKLQQVFQNLISNAIKYNDKEQGLIEIGCIERTDRTEFYVRDNGPGISDEEKESIFQLFWAGDSSTTTKESSTGVGLNLLKMLVEEQGGKIWAESKPGEGSTFFFEWLP
ncbi:response regulator receiver sensor signal transduction histidine kinase [Fibrisoma limi BUZ 3]|uniref:histidine kinase n=1 Tax=Fibrisoma limi BUZ 3 TaxID=1185876 RepID=I2GJ86_9BACT|nr:ATP-binding protein [Fibrisoma limi]CCH53961.1 response regulator receiver sensor signal transduction histidine kinase [Fibrisoma limi BUZ 3]